MTNLIFKIKEEREGGYSASCLVPEGGIFTQGDTWQELRDNIRDAVECFYFDATKPLTFRLKLILKESFNIT